MTPDVIFYAALALVVVAALVALSVTPRGCRCVLCDAKRAMRRAWRCVR